MAVTKSDEVVCAWNPEIESLVIIFINDNNTLYNVGGWFGKKLDEFLNGSDDLPTFLNDPSFSGSPQLTTIFQRLITTLAQNKVLHCDKADLPDSINPFSPEEEGDFGIEEFAGSLITQSLTSEELLAYAHTQSCRTIDLAHSNCRPEPSEFLIGQRCCILNEPELHNSLPHPHS